MEQRELKFRAWDRNAEEMIHEPGFICIDGNGFFDVFIESEGKWIKDNCVLMQYTGLPDKYGKEIYQSDIVECDYGRGEVVWMLGAWLVRWIDDKEADMEFLGLNKKGRRAREDGERFAVIGNIHQNPELLNQ